MPIRQTTTKKATLQVLKNTSREPLVESWLMEDGWQVYRPTCENGHKTDILISDGSKFYRIQIKTVEASGADHPVENMWKGCELDYIVVFARNSNWGYVMPAFNENRKSMNAKGHRRFTHSKNSFLKAFHQI